MQTHRATWDTYTSTWKQQSRTEREATFAKVLTDTCEYKDPIAATKGWESLMQYMESFNEQFPGAYFATTYFLAHHQRSIAKWEMRAGDAVLSDGISYGQYDEDGKLIAMTGFFEVPGE